jgi:hypothetical protein
MASSSSIASGACVIVTVAVVWLRLRVIVLSMASLPRIRLRPAQLP